MEIDPIKRDKLEDNFLIDFRYTFLQILNESQRTLIKLKLLNLKLLNLKKSNFLICCIFLRHQDQFFHIPPKLWKNRDILLNEFEF